MVGTVHSDHRGRPGTLVDDCPRCQEHAKSPFALDNDHLRMIIADPGSYLDEKVREDLRMWGRLIFRAGMTEDIAR